MAIRNIPKGIVLFCPTLTNANYLILLIDTHSCSAINNNTRSGKASEI